jgi:hypothetical protein
MKVGVETNVMRSQLGQDIYAPPTLQTTHLFAHHLERSPKIVAIENVDKASKGAITVGSDIVLDIEPKVHVYGQSTLASIYAAQAIDTGMTIGQRHSRIA